ncbi:MAG: DUF4290 domain-containing protein [Bacteroidota bacterium]|nr:DUF4290 domain-containing protein [Bacteroidota bacterium]
MNYNTEKAPLILPEYGRNVHLLIDIALKVEDKEDRTKIAYSIIDIMMSLGSQSKNQPEYMQKLWEHLYIMSDYKLDIDSPFPKPERKEKPFEYKDKKLLSYSKRHHKYHFYGENVELIIKKVTELEDEEMKNKIINSIANYMRTAYQSWNNDSVADEVIIGHLKELSNGKILLDVMPEAAKFKPSRKFGKKKSNNYKKKRRNKNKY